LPRRLLDQNRADHPRTHPRGIAKLQFTDVELRISLSENYKRSAFMHFSSETGLIQIKT
jgi:hypothetical protein